MVTYAFFSRTLPGFVIYAAFAALIFGLSYQRGFLSRILSTKVAVIGGLASYSLYMMHGVVRQVYLSDTFGMAPQPILIRVLLLIGLLVVLGGTSLACYFYVEEPANKALRRFVSKPKSSAPVQKAT